MTDIEKAKRMVQLFYIMRKEHFSIHDCHVLSQMRMRDVMTLGAILEEMEKSEVGMIKMSDVSNLFKITPAAVSQMVKEYEKKGWMVRVILENDRRSVYLRVTLQAQALMQQNQEKVMQGIVDFIRYLGDEDSDAFLRILDKTKAYGTIVK